MPDPLVVEFDRVAISKPSTGWRWGLCWLMFASTVLCYMDRQSMTLVGSEIKAEFQIQNEGFGWILAAFSLTYALFQVPAGYLADRCDVRSLYALAVVWWSLSAAALAFAPTLGILMVFRALLGFGESFNWPCALRATSAVLPPADRGLGNGIFNSGAAVGAVLTPWIVTPLAARYGWRPAFLIVASMGGIWVVAWLVMLRGPHRSILSGRGRSTSPPGVSDVAGIEGSRGRRGRLRRARGPVDPGRGPLAMVRDDGHLVGDRDASCSAS